MTGDKNDNSDIAVLQSQMVSMEKAFETSTDKTLHKIDNIGDQFAAFRLEMQRMLGANTREIRDELAAEREARTAGDADIRMELQRLELQPGSTKWNNMSSAILSALATAAVGAVLYFLNVGATP